jgi:hypothetical protein
MKISVSKIDFNYLAKLILTWTYLNFALNLLGLGISKLLNDAAYTYPDNVFVEFFGPILLQSLLFGILFLIGFLFLKNKNLAKYVFVSAQFLVFHLVFLFNLHIHNGLHFATSFSNFGLKYLSLSGQYLVDVLYLYFPITGNFQNGIFAPDFIEAFYIHWIFMTLLYYLLISLLSVVAVKFIFGKTKKDEQAV